MQIRKRVRKGTTEWKALQKKGKTGLGNARVDANTYLAPKIPGSNLRPFKKGNPGKVPGVQHEVPSSVKASVKTVLMEVAETEGLTIRKAIMEGLRGGPRNADRYIRMMAEYVDGKPGETIDLNAKIKDETIATSKTRINAKVATMVRNILKKREREE
jgi:hypothetical protein